MKKHLIGIVLLGFVMPLLVACGSSGDGSRSGVLCRSNEQFVVKVVMSYFEGAGRATVSSRPRPTDPGWTRMS